MNYIITTSSIIQTKIILCQKFNKIHLVVKGILYIKYIIYSQKCKLKIHKITSNHVTQKFWFNPFNFLKQILLDEIVFFDVHKIFIEKIKKKILIKFRTRDKS